MAEPCVVVVTGSSSGLGLATARALLRGGAKVMLSSNAPAELESACAELTAEHGTRVAACDCDMRHAGAVQALLDATLDAFGRVDAWINNAGTTAPSGPASLTPVADGRILLEVNIIGSYHGSVAALRHFRLQGQGRLINIVGRGERGPVAGAALYGSSKAWLRQFTLALAREEPELEIGTFNPGLLYTPLTARPRMLAGSEEKMLKGLRFIMPLIGDTPERAAKRLAALASGRAPLHRENVSRRLLPLLMRRLLTGRRAAIDVNSISPQVTAPDNGPLN